MENRKSEIDNIVPCFNAAMMDLISRHRQKRDAVNQVPGFIEAVERERERMTAKFNALLSNQDYADLAQEIHAAQHQVNQTCEAEIARASASKPNCGVRHINKRAARHAQIARQGRRPHWKGEVTWLRIRNRTVAEECR
jgi:chemotaxis regulatin CheY-phosphate phosphatase CheZ